MKKAQTSTQDKPETSRDSEGKFKPGTSGNPAGRPKLKRQVRRSKRYFKDQIPLALKRIIDSVLRRPQDELDQIELKDLLPTLTTLSRQVDALTSEREDINIIITRIEGVKTLEPEQAGETDWRLKRDRTYKALIAKLDKLTATVDEQTAVHREGREKASEGHTGA